MNHLLKILIFQVQLQVFLDLLQVVEVQEEALEVEEVQVGKNHLVKIFQIW